MFFHYFSKAGVHNIGIREGDDSVMRISLMLSKRCCSVPSRQPASYAIDKSFYCTLWDVWRAQHTRNLQVIIMAFTDRDMEGFLNLSGDFFPEYSSRNTAFLLLLHAPNMAG